MTTEELEIWKRFNELECVKKAFGEWIGGDMFTIPDEATLRMYHFQDHCEGCDYEVNNFGVIRIIPLYDPIRPERSLWYISGDIRWNWAENDKLQFMLDAHPDLALAQAIIEKEGM